MTVALVGIVLALIAERVWREREHARERRRLTNAIVAKNGGELIALEREPRDPDPEILKERQRARSLDNPLGA